jgi:hypothetical protein
VLIVISVGILFSACSRGDVVKVEESDAENETVEEQVFKMNELRDSNTNIYDVVTRTYTDDQLKEIISFSGNIDEYNAVYPTESLRIVNNEYEVVYIGDECYASVIFDMEGKKICDTLYNKGPNLEVFENLEEGETLGHVMEVDPNGYFPFLYAGRTDFPRLSIHYTADGYIITIYYDDFGLDDYKKYRIESIKRSLI